MVPFCLLLSKNAVFQWLLEHDHAFVEAKSHLSSSVPVLTNYAVDQKTIVATDTSRLKGLGLVLLHLVDVWKPVQASMGIADVENAQLQRLMMRMLPHSFIVEWVKGKDHLAADSFSHFPVDRPPLNGELCDVPIDPFQR